MRIENIFFLFKFTLTHLAFGFLIFVHIYIYIYIYITQQRDIYDTVIFSILTNLLRTDNETKSVKTIYN